MGLRTAKLLVCRTLNVAATAVPMERHPRSSWSPEDGAMMLIREPREGLTEEGTPWLRRTDEQGLKKRGGKVRGQVQGTIKGRQKEAVLEKQARGPEQHRFTGVRRL